MYGLGWLIEMLKIAHGAFSRSLFFTTLRMVLSCHTSLPSLLLVGRSKCPHIYYPWHFFLRTHSAESGAGR